MAFWLASARNGQDTDWIQRFDPRFWTVNFPRPMMAAVTTTAPDALRVDASFLTAGDLAGLIWDSTDSVDHALLAYDTDFDYSGTTLSFHWQSGGVIALDQVNGPTLTIEGKDASGATRSWYVRLWNYATGTPTDATITLDFSQLAGGWSLSSGADPVYPAAISRLFISLTPPGYTPGSTTPLASPVDAWISLSTIRCTGNRAMLRIGNVMMPPHGMAVATDFDDCTSQTPARLIRNLRQLGYRGSVLHYVGMSHHPRLVATSAGVSVATSGPVLCAAATAWHQSFLAACHTAGLSPILSLSYELLAQYCPAAWQQRASNGDAARTGWTPPSALLSPANDAAMGWLQSVARAFAALMAAQGVAVRIQIGEPWWWTMADRRICLYDDAAKAALGGNPVVIDDMRATLSASQKALLDQAGSILAASTAAVAAAVRGAVAPANAEVLLLTYLPTVLDPAMPEARRANLPVGWAKPAFDRLQLEDYEWLTGGATALRTAAYSLVNQRLGYAPADQDYLAGFVTGPDRIADWNRIDAGIDEATGRSAHEIFVWALPEICRDGFTRLPQNQDTNDMRAFDDVLYPLALSLDTRITPEFSTNVAVTASGYERRSSQWTNARLSFDVGPGIRSETDLGILIAFFRARRGAARGFRLVDPSDFSSNGMVGTPTAVDQLVGIGDGTTSTFPLVKLYGEPTEPTDWQQRRPITRPRAGSVLVSLNGVTVTNGWSLQPGGVIAFDTAPGAGVSIRAGFLFDVPVRFQQDTLEISGTSFAAGEAPSVPMIEIREAS